MKITKRQLRRIIKEERAAIVKEGMMKEREMQLIDNILDIMIEYGAINRDRPYKEGAEYIQGAVLPALLDMAATAGVWSEEEDYEAGFKR